MHLLRQGDVASFSEPCSEQSPSLGSLVRLPLELRLEIYTLVLDGLQESSAKGKHDQSLSIQPLLYLSKFILGEIILHYSLKGASSQVQFANPYDAYHVLLWSNRIFPFDNGHKLLDRVDKLRILPFECLQHSVPNEWDIRNLTSFGTGYDNKLERRILHIAKLWRNVFKVLPRQLQHIEIDVSMWIYVTKVQGRRPYGQVPSQKQDEWFKKVIDPLTQLATERTSDNVAIEFTPHCSNAKRPLPPISLKSAVKITPTLVAETIAL